MDTAPDSMSAFALAEAFAEDHVQALEQALQLERESSGSDLAAVAPNPLLIAHVIGLHSHLTQKRGGVWASRFAPLCASRAVAIHVWLYHLGPSEHLEAPTGKATQSKAVLRAVEKEVQSFTTHRNELVSLQRRRAASGEDTSVVESKLADLYNGVLQPFNWKVLPANSPPPPPPPAPATMGEEEGHHHHRLALAMGVSSPESPLYIMGGHGDLLLQICRLAWGSQAAHVYVRRALPQKETLRALYLQHAEVLALREQIDERDTLIHELQTLLARSARREEHAARLAEEARASIQKAEDDAAEEIKRVLEEAEKEWKRKERELKREKRESDVEWQLFANRLQNDKADAMREMDRNRRAELVDLAKARDLAKQQAKALDGALECERGSTNKLREMRGGSSWLEARRRLEEENKLLKQRRTLNQRRISDANLADQRARASTEAYRKVREKIQEVWRSEEFISIEQYASLESQVASLKIEVEALKEEVLKLKEITAPGSRHFYQSGHFSAVVDLAIVQCLQLGVNRAKVPQLFLVFAKFFRIQTPTHTRRVRGPDADGKRTAVERVLLYIPSQRHVKDVAGMMYQLNKLQVGEWLLDYLNSDEETSCCYLADGAESMQVEQLGQLLSRRVDGKIEMKALDLKALSSKTADAQASAFHDTIESVVAILERAELADSRAASLLRKFVPTCGMNDRASTARAATRKVLGLADGDDDPTCAEHALVNVLEEGRKAMDSVLRGMMNITDEQAEADAAKIKAMRTCVGWFSSPACALIYQVAKYVALCSTKGYAIGRKFLEWIETRLADQEEQSELLGHSEDLLAICGSRMYVFFLDAAPTERLVSQEGSLLTYLQEEDDLGAENGGKLRRSILTGAGSDPCMAALRAMAVICDSVMWRLLPAIKPTADKHVLDVLSVVWPKALAFCKAAGANPSSVVDGSVVMDLGAASGSSPAAPITAGEASRSSRSLLDMIRIRRAAQGCPLIEKLLVAAFDAMAKGIANHASEWLPAGELKTDGSLTGEGKLSATKITPELRARYDALPSTSTSVERLHAIGRAVDKNAGLQRQEGRSGVSLAKFNDQSRWLGMKSSTVLQKLFNVSRTEARLARKTTMKEQRILEGRAKRQEREAKLKSKRARREAKKAETARISSVQLASTYSQLTTIAIPELQDQLKAWKQQQKEGGFTVTQKDREAYVLQLQALIFEAHGAEANDLPDGDSGTGSGRVVRQRRVQPSGNKKRKVREMHGFQWFDDEQFNIDRLLDKKVETIFVGRGKNRKRQEIIYYKVLWKDYPPEVATWEPASEIHDDYIDDYEAAIEAEEELAAEENGGEDGEDDEEEC